MNDLEVMVGKYKVFISMARDGNVTIRIGYGDSGAPEFSVVEWEEFTTAVKALLTTFTAYAE